MPLYGLPSGRLIGQREYDQIKEALMEGNDELQKKARGDEIAIKGTIKPDVTGEDRRAFTDPDGETLDQRIARNQPEPDEE